MHEKKNYDAIIIGAGQGGVPLGMALANAGWKTALVERKHVGGTCINEGCTPTKTMIASARIAYLSRRARNYGVHTGDLRIDMEKVRKRKRNIVASFRSGSERRINETKNLHLLEGEASFSGFKTISVKEAKGNVKELSSETIIINTGTHPSIPAVEGIEQVSFYTSTTIMELDTVPEHLLIIGGGYIGLEFGQMFARFGSKVTLIHRGKQLLSREDPDVAAEVLSVLREDGIDVLLESTPVSVESTGRGISLQVKNKNAGDTLQGSHLLAATGRVPNTHSLKLELTSVRTDDRGFVQVNERLETTTSGIYAIGDVKGGPMFTHISYDDFRVLKRNLLTGENATIKGRLVPYTVFIDPQLGRVGMSEKEAKAAGKRIRVAKLPMDWVARAIEVDESRGFMKAVIDAQNDQILGCAVLGIEGGEIAAIIQMAMMGGVTHHRIRDAVFAHPTIAESLNNLFAHIEEE
ncbi:MAG: mercuric reductase [Spirochaetes bacterium DG_61]|jgi:pyruvate/2-oxoglutarate dehydrogenase complex dihydrolipoamide dehydrogenase (E3) component|nr:MAG: mercuric reductase [Spirochaetes bacterium DG_61]